MGTDVAIVYCTVGQQSSYVMAMPTADVQQRIIIWIRGQGTSKLEDVLRPVHAVLLMLLPC